jgi:SAM-dependent methyltransferase
MLGILILRQDDDPYAGNQFDLQVAHYLVSQFDQMNFRQLLEAYYSQFCPELTPAMRSHQLDHITKGVELSSSLQTLLLERMTHGEGCILDMGTGTGGSVIGMLASVPKAQVIGLDIVHLVCGSAEKLPFTKCTFDVIFGGDMIEHVHAPDRVFEDSIRTLSNRGVALFPTPNRTSLTREPHVGLRFAGWLPRSLTPLYCRLFCAPAWQGIFTHTYFGWLNILRLASVAKSDVAVSVKPSLVRTESGNRFHPVRIYNTLLMRSLPFRWFASIFGPVLELEIKKELPKT